MDTTYLVIVDLPAYRGVLGPVKQSRRVYWLQAPSHMAAAHAGRLCCVGESPKPTGRPIGNIMVVEADAVQTFKSTVVLSRSRSSDVDR